MKWKIAIPILIVIAVAGALVYLNSTRVESPSNSTDASGIEQLLVSPQDVRTSVTIDHATVSKGGYIVVRGGDGKRIGQIIEISNYLPAGEHENITIELGEFYTYKEDDQLIVMIYYDDGDNLFSELDEPVNTSAVFARTGKQVPLSVFADQIAPSDGMGMVTVRYTNSGFQPQKLTVSVGTMVEFINQSDREMWVASNMHPAHEILSTLDQFKGVGKGQTYMYTFDKKGTWPYHDHINASLEGVIVAE